MSPSTGGGWQSGRDPSGEAREKYAYFLQGARTKLNAATAGTAAAGETTDGEPAQAERTEAADDADDVPAVAQPCAVRAAGPASDRGLPPAPGPCRVHPGRSRPRARAGSARATAGTPAVGAGRAAGAGSRWCEGGAGRPPHAGRRRPGPDRFRGGGRARRTHRGHRSGDGRVGEACDPGREAARAAGLTVTDRTLRAWQAGARSPSLENVARYLLTRLDRDGRGTRVEVRPGQPVPGRFPQSPTARSNSSEPTGQCDSDFGR